MFQQKTIYSLVLCCTLLAGCTAEEAAGPKPTAEEAVPIAFDCTIADDAATRAANGYTGNITQENKQLRYAGFGVFACQQAGNTPDLMYNQQVTFTFFSNNTGNGYWTYSPLKYWPNSNADKVCFYAYAPYVPTPSTMPADATGIIGMSSNTATTPYILYARAKHPEDHVDLLWAAYKPGAIMPVRFAVEKDENDVIIADHSLHHALARVKVSLGITDEAGATTLSATDKLLIERVTFTGNFAKKGTLDLTSTGTTPSWSDQELADPNTDPATDKTIFTDCNPETYADSYGIIAESARYINGLPYNWQPAGVSHADVTNLLCMGDVPSYLYLIPQSALTLSCVIDYYIMTAAGEKTAYHKTLADDTSINISPLNGNTTYDLTLKLKFDLP